MERVKKSGYDLTKGPILQTMLVYAVPILVSALIQYLYNVFDTAMVGKWLGETQMAAVNAAGTTSGLLTSLIGGFSAGIVVIVGINYGAGNEEGTLRAIVVSEKLSLIAGVFFTLAGVLCAEPLLRVTNVPDECMGYSRTYLYIIVGCAVVTMFNNAHTNLLRTLGDSRSPVIMLVASAVINVVLNLVFMLWFRWGVAGVAIATVISQLVSAAFALVFFLRHYPQFNFFRRRAEGASGKVWAEEIKMAIPMAFQQSMIMLGAVIVQAKVNDMGSSVMAAYATSNSVNNMAGTVINTFGTVISGFVAQNFGARRFDRIKTGMGWILVCSWAVSALLAAALLLCARPIVGLFLKEWNEELFLNVRTFLYINTLFYLIWVPVPVLRCAIQSMHNSLLPFLSCLVELPMRCATAWVLGEHFGFMGLSFATPCALVAAFLFLIVAFFVQWKKKTKNVSAAEEKPAEECEEK